MLLTIAVKIVIHNIKKQVGWKASWIYTIKRAILDTCENVTPEEATKAAELWLKRFIEYKNY